MNTNTAGYANDSKNNININNNNSVKPVVIKQEESHNQIDYGIVIGNTSGKNNIKDRLQALKDKREKIKKQKENGV